MKTIRGKFLVLIIVGFVCLANILCAVSLVMTRDILHEDADEILNAVAQKEALGFNGILESVEDAAHIIEMSIILKVNDLKRFSQNKWLREDVTEDAKSTFHSIARNTDEVASFYVRYDPDLLGNVSGGGEHAGFFMTYDEEKGDYTSAPMVSLDITDPAYVGWYYSAKRAENPIWMEPYDNKNIDVYMISYVVPLYCGDTFFGVVGADIDFTKMMSAVDKIRVFENGYAYLVDEDGELRYEPEYASVANVDSSHSTSAAVKLENGMSLVVIADYEDIQKDSRTLFFTIAIIALVMLIPFIFITIFITNKMTRPLKDLTNAARQLATGDTSVQLECDSDDEIGELSAVFNETVLKIRDYMSYVNSLAYRDGLTGIKNRTAFIESAAKMNKKIEEAPYNTEFAVIVADVNGLKKANDIYGHDIGNKLLKAVSQALCDTFKRSPVFRIGGDEFVVILENSDYSRYKTLIKEFDAVCQKTYVDLENDKLPVMVARGISIYYPGSDKCFDDVSKRADREMYIHKELMKRANG